MRNRVGQNTVELALALPMVALLLVIAVDFARIYYVAAVVATASRVAAEYAATHGPTTPPWADVERRARDELGSLTGVSVVPDPAYPDWKTDPALAPAPGELLMIRVSYTYYPWTPLARSFMPSGTPLISRTLMRRNCPPTSSTNQVAACAPIPTPTP